MINEDSSTSGGSTVADDPRWSLVLSRDKAADGAFWYSVRTTGVFCRPSCASRTANPVNVRLHDTIEDARASGYRPCKRCNPEGSSQDEQNAALVEAATLLIKSAATPPSLAELAEAAGLSPAYFHRIFKSATGLTPRGYAAARRAEGVRAELSKGTSVTEAIYAAGFGSNGRFYEEAQAMLGMKPSNYRSGGANETLRFAVGQTSLGAVVVASSERGVASILLGDDPETLLQDLQDRFPRATLVGGDGDYESLVAQVAGMVDRPGSGTDLPLDVRGTAFQQRVWEALRRVPPGTTTTYSAIAAAIGSPTATRAVAGACAANPVAVAIPCHRVVRNDGGLSGYRWGVDRKRVLLEREAAAA